MSLPIPVALQREVRERAGNCCEYCLLPQSSQEATFHIDHVRPLSAGGETILANLALACVTCSLKKGARVRAKDPRTWKLTPLFHPRNQSWKKHFRLSAASRIIGKTACGRATTLALAFNRPALVEIRKLLIFLDAFPFPS